MSSKYQYRSSVIVEDDDDFNPAPKSLPPDSLNVVDRFIRVIESKDPVRDIMPVVFCSDKIVFVVELSLLCLDLLP